MANFQILPNNIWVEAHSNESYKAYALGLGIDLGVRILAGYTYKDINSNIINTPYDTLNLKARVNAKDFGFLVNFHVSRLLNFHPKQISSSNVYLYPDLEFSIGYSKANISDSVKYSNSNYHDPLSRIQRAGYGLTAGFDVIINDFKIRAFNLSFTAMADDDLIKSSPNYRWSYSNSSDLNIWKHILLIRGDDKVVAHAGTKLEFYEFFAYSFGHFDGRGFFMRKTNGIELKSDGLFKTLNLFFDESVIRFFNNHLKVIYYNTNFFVGSGFETKMEGIAIHLINLNKLFKN